MAHAAGRQARVGTLLAATLCSCLVAFAFAATPTFVQSTLSVKDLATPQNQTVAAGTVWYRCGLGSTMKIKLSVKSSVNLDTFVSAGENAVKRANYELPTSSGAAATVDNLVAKAKYSYEGGTFCQQTTSCDKTVRGRLLIYDRCIAVSNARSSSGTASFTIQAQLQTDTLVIVIWVAIALGIGLFILMIACCVCKALSCCCCPTPCCCC